MGIFWKLSTTFLCSDLPLKLKLRVHFKTLYEQLQAEDTRTDEKTYFRTLEFGFKTGSSKEGHLRGWISCLQQVWYWNDQHLYIPYGMFCSNRHWDDSEIRQTCSRNITNLGLIPASPFVCVLDHGLDVSQHASPQTWSSSTRTAHSAGVWTRKGEGEICYTVPVKMILWDRVRR